MIKANIHHAKTHLSKLIEQAAAGEEVIIAKAGKPVAKLVAIEAEARPEPGAWLGSLKGKIWYAPDYDQADAEIERLFYEGDPLPPEDKAAED